MDIYCEKCQKVVGKVADEKVPIGKKASVTCPKCSDKIVLTRMPPPPPESADVEDTVLWVSEEENKGNQTSAPISEPLQESPTESKIKHEPAKSADQEYDFAIMDIIRESWQKTSGAKGPIWAGGFLVFAVVVGLTIVMGIFMGFIGDGSSGAAFSAAMQLAINVALYPFLAGIMMIGIRRSVDQPISYKLTFSYFSFFVPIIISAFLVTLMTSIGYVLLIVPGIYLSVGYLLVIPLIVEKGMGPWEAMEASRKAIHKHWFKVFGLYFVMGIIFMLSMIPLLIGLIWTMPMMIVMVGVLYREIFGVDEN